MCGRFWGLKPKNIEWLHTDMITSMIVSYWCDGQRLHKGTLRPDSPDSKTGVFGQHGHYWNYTTSDIGIHSEHCPFFINCLFKAETTTGIYKLMYMGNMSSNNLSQTSVLQKIALHVLNWLNHSETFVNMFVTI